MPRTGGVYSPPAGTKGTPNTTIQSVPYNTFIDDLTADANAARPITAGGTGATSASAARTALGLAIGTNVQAYDAGLQSISGLTTVADQMLYTTALDVYATTALTPFARTILDDADAATVRATVGANNASNLTTGTVADARLPTSMAGKTFTSNVNFGAGTSVADGDAYLTLNGDRPWVLRQRGEDTTANLSIENNSNKSIGFSCDNTYAGAVIVINPLTSNPYITVAGNTVWHAGNSGPGSGSNMDLLDGQHGAFYQNLANATGTLADARLPTTMSGKIFTGTIHMTGSSGGIELGAVGSSNTPTADFHSGAFTTDYDVRLIASGGTAANGAGALDVICATLTKGGNTIWHAGNDGAGSGADADLLDGQQGSYYADIPSRLGFTPVQQGGGTGQGTNKVYVGWLGSTLGLQIDTTNYGATWPIGISGTAANASAVGGVALSGLAQVYTGSNANETNYPIGYTIAMFTAGSSVNRNATASPCLSSADSLYFREVGDANAGTALSGTWRSRGMISSDYALMERVL